MEFSEDLKLNELYKVKINKFVWEIIFIVKKSAPFCPTLLANELVRYIEKKNIKTKFHQIGIHFR